MAPRKGKGGKAIKELLGPENLVKARFVNIESPGTSLEFDFNGTHYGPWEDGAVVSVHKVTIRHINSLSTLRMEYRLDPVTGQQRSVVIGQNHRFSLTVVDDGKDDDDDGKDDTPEQARPQVPAAA